MHQFDLNECYQKLKHLVVKAGRTAKKKINTLAVSHVKGKDDVVTEADLLVEDIIFNFIEKHYPGHGFISEEMGEKKKDSDYIWILDPIDGTKHYIKGLPLYSVSLALEYRCNLILGIVYLPETNQLFCAGDFNNQGALVNNKRIYCSNEEKMENCIVCLEIPGKNAGIDILNNGINRIQVLMKKVKRVRIIGVGSIGLCYCASGGYDFYLNLGSNFGYHDYAAGKVIMEQAGGEFRRLNNALVAGNSVIVKKVMDLLDLD